MQFQVTDIEFDFDGEDLIKQDMIDIIENSLGAWEADDEDDLIAEVSTASGGWCIKSIDYHLIPKSF